MNRTLRARTIFFLCVALAGTQFTGCTSTKKKGSGEGDGTGTISDEDLALQNQGRWADGGTIPNAQAGGRFQDIHFGFDSASVGPEYQQTVRDVASALKGDPTLHVDIEGHCDSRGTSEYNMALGERRAKAVGRMLFDYGVPSSQIATVSYGEELPLVQGESEDAWSQNRRAHFAVYKKGAGREQG